MQERPPGAFGDSIDLRPATPEDFEFAFRVYEQTMKGYSAAYISWDQDRQKSSLANQLPSADISIITLSGVAIGWLALMENASSLFLGHFYLDPQFHNRGIGSAILSRIIESALAKGKPVELSVLRNNPARRLYERFGFVVESEDEMRYFMKRAN